MSTTTKTIKYLRGARFVDTEVQSGSISQLRTEMEIPVGASISVNGRDVTDTYELQEEFNYSPLLGRPIAAQRPHLPQFGLIYWRRRRD